MRITGLTAAGDVHVQWDAPEPPLDYRYYVRYRRVEVLPRARPAQ